MSILQGTVHTMCDLEIDGAKKCATQIHTNGTAAILGTCSDMDCRKW